jgi:hypothetical protein
VSRVIQAKNNPANCRVIKNMLVGFYTHISENKNRILKIV